MKTPQPAPRVRLQIRRCRGNRAAWALIGVGPDGKPLLDGIPLHTSLSLDRLVADAACVVMPGERIELVIGEPEPAP